MERTPQQDRLDWVIRTHLRTTQAAFADTLGVHPQQVSRWLRNPDRPPSSDSWAKIGEAAGVDPVWLEHGVGTPIPGSADSVVDALGELGELSAVLERLDPGTLLAAAYRTALEEGWSLEALRALDRIRDDLVQGRDPTVESLKSTGGPA